VALACGFGGAGAADVFVTPPPFNPAPAEQVAFELLVDIGPDVLGSYAFTLTYDPAVVHVSGIAGGTTAEFSGAPATNPATFASGSTPLAAAQGSSVSPSGFLSVATVTLAAVGLPGDSSDLDLPSVSMFDAQFEAVDATVFPTSVVVAVPEVPSDLVFADGATLEWTDLADIPSYNVYRGTFGGSFGFDHACHLSGLGAATAAVPGDPAVSGTGFYYLASAVRNGVEGSLGTTSGGQFRPNLSPCASARSATGSDSAPPARVIARPVLPDSRPAPNSAPAPAAPEPTGLPVLAASGDVDGDGRRSDRDARRILEAVVGARTLDLEARAAADVTGDGRLDPADAQMLLRFVAGGGEPAEAAGDAAYAVVLGSSDCSGVTIRAGLNSVRMRCLPEGYTAFRLLADLGAVDGEAVQSWDGTRYRTARREAGALLGEDFPIVPLERYLILAHVDRPAFLAAPAAGGDR